MTNILDSLEDPTSNQPFQGTFVSDGGLGKTTLAATIIPNSVILRIEDGTASLDQLKKLGLPVPKNFPVATNSDTIFNQLKALGTEEHKFDGVIIDTITRMHIMFEKEIVENDPKNPKSINQACGGYGNGPLAVAEMHRKVKAMCDALKRKGLHVIFLAHAETETIDPPDNDSYTRYTLAMNKKSISHYTNDVDMVGYIALETFTTSDEDSIRSKATSTGKRKIICYPTANNVGKNRYGVTEDINFELGTNPFIDIIPSLQMVKPKAKKKIA